MALVAMAVYDTDENRRTWMTAATLASLAHTVNWDRHRLFVIDNASCKETKQLLGMARGWLPFSLFTLDENVGTARAINKAIGCRGAGQHVVKIDNDVWIHSPGWLDKMEACVAAEQRLGVVGMKRRDLDETPHAPEGSWARSELVQIKHKKGQVWHYVGHYVEAVNHAMGTCVLMSSALLDKVGYLVQAGKYGFDDSLLAYRAKAAGFFSAFLLNYDIEHVDPGDTRYQQWKQAEAGKRMPLYEKVRDEYLSGARSFFHGPDEDLDDLFK